MATIITCFFTVSHNYSYTIATSDHLYCNFLNTAKRALFGNMDPQTPKIFSH